MSRHRKTDKPGLVDKVRAMAALASIRGLSPAAVKVALRLLDHFNCGTGRCDPSVDTLAEATGHDSRTVSRAIGRLEALGLFHVTRRSGRRRSNSYRPDFTRFNTKTPAISSSFQVGADETAQNPATRSGNTGGMIPENPVEWPDKTIKETIKKLGEATPNFGAVQGSACEGSVRQGEPNSNGTSHIAWAAWHRWLDEDVGIKSPMVWLLKQFTRVQSQAKVGPREAERLVDSVLQEAQGAEATEARLLQMIEDAIIQSHDKRGDERPKPNSSGCAGRPNGEPAKGAPDAYRSTREPNESSDRRPDPSGPLQAPASPDLTNKPERGQHDADASAESANDSGETEAGFEAATKSKRARIIELNRIWREKVSVLEGPLGKHHHRQWIEPLCAEEDDGQTLTVACPTHFHLDWINTHFKDKIRDAVGREILLIVTSDCAAAARRKSHPK